MNINMSKIIFLPLIFLAAVVFLYEPVYGAVTLASGSTLTGRGTLTEGGVCKRYHMTAFIDESRSRLHITIDGESFDLILTNGAIYDSDMSLQKPSALLAKIITLGVLDPFFVLEVLIGERSELYAPFMIHDDQKGTIKLDINPSEFLALYDHWIPEVNESALVESFLRQILIALEPTVSYTFYLDDANITKIEITSRSSAPEVRHVRGIVQLVSVTNQLNSAS